MPTLTKQSIINLLIDSPLREPIKINLVDIVNNTKDEDLPKVFPTINKELEIFQKATTRRLKLADDTIKKLSTSPITTSTESTEPPAKTTPPATSTPPKPLPPLSPASAEPDTKTEPTALQVPPLKLPPLPQPAAPTQPPKPSETTPPPSPTINPTPTPKPLPPLPPLSTEATTPAKSSEQADETALKEIQKELDALKNDATADLSAQADAAITPPTTPTS